MSHTSRADPGHKYAAVTCLPALFLAALAAAPATGAPGTAAAPAVVELFTSEGCSSCPPAEAVLRSLATRPDVLALAFHVTYWDSFDWRDAFGLTEAASRQGRYVRSLGLASAYTPQVVVNGMRDVLGSDGRDIERSIGQLPNPARVLGVRSGTGWIVRLPELPTACPCTLHLISVRSVADTLVHGGENAGRNLREYRIVRSVLAAGSWDGRAAERVIPLDSMPSDATSVVVLAERQRDLSIVATGEMVLQADE